MEMPPAECYAALKARDPRFDGRFFVCVSSTGIYCRPVCPARTPKLEHCRFVPTAATAEAAGYRACLRCRPETAPGSPAWLGTETTVRRALRMIANTADEPLSLRSIAGRVGVTDRHLRRLFNEHLGATPKAIAQNERLAAARQLLLGTRIPVGDIAFAAGFGSLRRFNDAARKAFGKTPSELRTQAELSNRDRAERLRFTLAYRPPYDWSSMLDYYRARAVAGLETVTSNAYSRAISIGDAVGTLSVTPDKERNRVTAEFALDRPASLPGAIRRVREVFDLDASPADISAHLARDPLLKPAVRRNPGLRIPGSWDIFEMLIRAIVGQQISVRAATTVLGRLVEYHGRRLGSATDAESASSPASLFPTPAALASADLTRAGLTRSRAETIARVARAFADDPHFVDVSMDFDAVRNKLVEIRGIGPWTADYVAMRALRDPDAFLPADLGVIKAVGVKSVRQLLERAEPWRPWRAYAVVYLWKTLAPE